MVLGKNLSDPYFPTKGYLYLSTCLQKSVIIIESSDNKILDQSFRHKTGIQVKKFPLVFGLIT